MSQSFTKSTPLDTDASLSTNSDYIAPSQKAVKAYVDARAGGNGTFQRIISADLTFATGECLVLTGYLDLVTYSLTLDGDAQLEVL